MKYHEPVSVQILVTATLNGTKCQQARKHFSEESPPSLLSHNARLLPPQHRHDRAGALPVLFFACD
eukprot:3023431-Rhodomonas_salina.8